jgi:hypothetical protein
MIHIQYTKTVYVNITNRLPDPIYKTWGFKFSLFKIADWLQHFSGLHVKRNASETNKFLLLWKGQILFNDVGIMVLPITKFKNRSGLTFHTKY